jgi:hypothetical protein
VLLLVLLVLLLEEQIGLCILLSWLPGTASQQVYICVALAACISQIKVLYASSVHAECLMCHTHCRWVIKHLLELLLVLGPLCKLGSTVWRVQSLTAVA